MALAVALAALALHACSAGPPPTPAHDAPSLPRSDGIRSLAPVPSSVPALDARTIRPEFLGSGRDDAPPAGLREILVAHFGPGDPDHPDWGDAWRGAQIAVDRVNAAGGCGGLPLRLVPVWSESPWGSGTADLAKLVLEHGAVDPDSSRARPGAPEPNTAPGQADSREPAPHRSVWAIIGGMDGTTTHLAEQIAVKTRIALVGPGGTDASVNLTNVAWMFTLPATDDRIASVLVDAVLRGDATEPWAVVTTTDRDSRAAWRAVARELSSRRAGAPVLHLTLPPGFPDPARAASEVARTGARVALVLAGARDAGVVVRALRGNGFDGRIVAGAAAGRRPFAIAAREYAQGVEFPLLFDPDRPEAAVFVNAFEARWGTAPDFLAAHACDATSLVAEAVRRAGPNRARIRDALATLVPWPGVTGTVAWDATGRNTAPIAAGVWRFGRAVRREGAAPAGRRR